MSQSSCSLKDIYPPTGHVQHLYCDICKGHLRLAYGDFDKEVSGIRVRISGLPFLHCDTCKKDYLPDDSRFAIIYLHEQAMKQGVSAIQSNRQKPNVKYDLTPIPFDYDSDDYRYLPGLMRPQADGFLAPVFFNRAVLLKYDSLPDYSVKFASTTYGTIAGPTFYISFGINKSGKVIMWLGDIAALPEKEQYYLRSENIPSDHDIGSEFYDGQIECIFTEPAKEQAVFALRSDFMEAAFKKFNIKIAHLDEEVLDLASSLNAPLTDTKKERERVADALNKVYVESFDNKALASIMKSLGGDPKDLGTLKRLQAILEAIANGQDVATTMSPFFTLYDFRVASLHLTSIETAKQKLKTVTDRLKLPETATLSDIYSAILDGLSDSFEKMTAIVEGR
ncbi:hypothetical protein IVA86_28400 [Bradyrhizobium sp. 146]|uniref:hypothetical protein n=1 Tax=Bradyrhizobium sp. 146 TaxID=2782622 RepID=UPI001FFBBB4B|nr:hypothetical protein [Bradyrhizobium sp. 146]MCK1705220.1 hypothetical protein [Bradyrhizobium sp. 146]